ncbi:MAG: PKD domain-containing protein [Planctomycetota bacterium]
MSVHERKLCWLRLPTLIGCVLALRCSSVPQEPQALLSDGLGALSSDVDQPEDPSDVQVAPAGLDAVVQPSESSGSLQGAGGKPKLNRPPVADAGPDIVVNEGEPVMLDGSQSKDPDRERLTFSWRQADGNPSVTLSRPRSMRASFTAPEVDGDTLLQFTLTVSDGEYTAIATVPVAILDLDANIVVDAGPDQDATAGSTVILAGVVENGAGVLSLAVAWRQIAGPAILLSAPTGLLTTFQAPDPSATAVVLSFELEVSSWGLVASDQVSVTIQPSVAPPGPGCSNNVACDDGIVCNGVEAYDVATGICHFGTPPDCNDGVACTIDSCDEANDTCVHAPDNSLCDDGQYCNGVEVCDSLAGCQLGPAPNCDDGVACTSDQCDALLDCQNIDNCPVGEICNLATGLCRAVAPLPMVEGDAWRYFKGTREPSPGNLMAWTSLLFDDSTWLEDPSGFGYGTDCAPYGTVLADMPNGYLSLYGRRLFDIEDPSALTELVLTVDYDDSFVAYINGVPVARNNVVGTPPPFNQLATVDHECSGSPGAANPPESFSIHASFDLQTLLHAGANVLAIQGHNLSSGSSDFTLLATLRATLATCTLDAECDDGAFCNGAERCVNRTCVAGTPPTVNDVVVCTIDTCDEVNNVIVHTPDNSACDNGSFCDGAEFCNPILGCQDAADPCNPPLICDEPNDRCVMCLTDAQCDDGLFCNGAEICLNGVCQSGEDPCPSAVCNESPDSCGSLLCDGLSEPFLPGQQVGTLLGSVADEASGLVASRKNPDVLWTHNDDTGDNRVFAININGSLLGTYTLGSGSNDPEDIAIGPGPVPGVDYLYWGNIGDNNNVRSTIFVKRVPEPTISANQAPPVNVSLAGVDTLTFVYPTGSYAPSHKDAETLLVDPLSGDIYIVTKRTAAGMVYRAAYPQSTTQVTTLEYVTSIDWGGAVGGDVSPDGQLIIIRRYSGNSPEASIWTRPEGKNLWDAFSQPRCDVYLMPEPQGEAICWDGFGQGYYTVSENQIPGAQIPIWYFARNRQ